MSYCRKSKDSDLYIYFSDGDFWHCCMCPLNEYPRDPLNEQFITLAELQSHIVKHEMVKHKVPIGLYQQIDDEIQKGIYTSGDMREYLDSLE